MIKHTPGPWKPMWSGRGKMVFHHVSATAPAIPGFCGERPVEIASISGTDPQTDAANARLIAAAPELLRALQAVVNDCHDLDMVPSNERGRTTTAFELAVSAIEKATGES